MDELEAIHGSGSLPSVEQVNERATFMTRLVDSLLRGRAQPSARNEAAAAVSDVRDFVRAWRPAPSCASSSEVAAAGSTSQVHAPDAHQHGGGAANGEGREDQGGDPSDRSSGSGGSGGSSSPLVPSKPSADLLLKLAQRGVQLHNNVRKLPQVRDSGGGSGSGGQDWKSATVAYLRAGAASLVSLGSTSSPKDCANLCRLFSKAGELLVEDARDDIRALEMFEDAETFFRRLPASFYGASADGRDSARVPHMPSLSAEDLIMAAHKASSRRVEVLCRTTGSVDQMVECYEKQLEVLALTKRSSPAGLGASTAAHAASTGEERFRKGDCRGASRLLRLALQALGGGDPCSAGESQPTTAGTGATTLHARGLRQALLFSLAHCCSKSGEHNQAIQCMKQLESDNRSHGAAPDGWAANAPDFLFAKCKVLADAGDLAGAYDAANSLVAATPPPTPAATPLPRAAAAAAAGLRGAVVRPVEAEQHQDLDLVAARMMCSSDDASERSLDLFASIAERFPGTPKAFNARVGLLAGLAASARLRSQGRGLERRRDADDGEKSPPPPLATGKPLPHTGLGLGLAPRYGLGPGLGPGVDENTSAERAERAEKTADAVVAAVSKCVGLAGPQVEAALEVLATFAEVFQDRGEWEACARWCGRAITVAGGASSGQEAAAAAGLASAPSSALSSAGSVGGVEGGASGGTGGSGGGSSAADEKEEGAALLLASLLSLRGEMECRMGDFASSSHTLDLALAECPGYARAREVAFWAAACDPGRDETSLSARLSALTGPRSSLVTGAARQAYLAKCVGLVVGARATAEDQPEGTGNGAATPATPCTRTTLAAGTGDGNAARHDTRVIMVQERLLEALLLAPPVPATAPATAPASATATGKDEPRRLAPVPMDVDAGGQGVEPASGTGTSAGGSGVGGVVPTAVQVVASMVDSALQSTSIDARGAAAAPAIGDDSGGGGAGAGAGSSDGGVVCSVSALLSRVLLSVDKALLASSSLGIGPSDDPDLEYLSKGCWNLAVRCCGSSCDLPWADGAGSSARKDRDVMEGRRNPLLVLAPAFFKASRHWTELRSDANVAEALLTRQSCVVLSISATLELYDAPAADEGSGSASGSRDNGPKERRDMLERARKDVEVATGLNRELASVKPEKAAEMRSILLVAEMSVLGRLHDAVAVRSLVASREPDLLRCSTSLLQYCVQLAEDVLDDARSTAGLCRLCIRRCLEDDPVDTPALGGLYRRLLVSASSREEALLTVDDFSARARDLQECTPGVPADDVDYVAAKSYNLGLQLMEMGRAGEAERFVGKALGLVKLGSSQAFKDRWEGMIYQVYRTALEVKGGGKGPPGSLSRSSGSTSTGATSDEAAFGPPRRVSLSTGLFPLPSGAAAGQALYM